VARSICVIISGGVKTAASTKEPTITYLYLEISHLSVSTPSFAKIKLKTGSSNTTPNINNSFVTKDRYSPILIFASMPIDIYSS